MAPGDGDAMTFSVEQSRINAAQEVTNVHLQASINELKSDVGTIKTDVAYIRGRYEANDQKKERSFSIKQGIGLTVLGGFITWLIDLFHFKL